MSIPGSLCACVHTLFLVLLQASATAAATIKAVEADQSQEGNPARHAFDTDEQTRWAAEGQGRWIQLELDEPKSLSKIGIGFARSERNYRFDIRTSYDGNAWSAPNKHQSKGRSEVVDYSFPKESARFVRVTVFGSDQNDWANIHTILVGGVASLSTAVATSSPSGGDLIVTEWASGPAVINGVGLSIDDLGRAYVTSVKRRKQSSLDIRNHQDLVKQDLSFETVEQRREFYRSYLTGKDWLPDRNEDGRRDWRDLTVQRDNVTQVSDRDGDGKAETFRVVDEFHSEVTGVAAGVLAVGNEVFAAVEPDFLRYSDNDDDGLPETKHVVGTGFQVHMGQGGHNMSGVALGPDGRVYWSLGDKGHHVTTKEGKTYHRPNSGAIFRCEMDGSNLERYSTGERNAQELAFDPHGNLFSMDNDGDYPGEMERALYITEGSEHGWRLNWQWMRKQDFTKISGLDAYNPWMEERLFLPDHESFAAYLTPTIGNFGPGPCGFTNNPGTALSPELTDRFFMTNQKGEVRVLSFLPKGAYFSFEEHAPLKGGVNNTGLAIGPDGALYAASYGNKKGAIYRFDVSQDHQHPLRAETQAILAGDALQASVEELLRWIDHADQRVRMKAQFELVRRGDFGKLNIALINQKSSLLGKLHAIWGIGQNLRKQQHMAIFLLAVVADTLGEPEMIAQAAKVLGDLDPESEHAVIFRPHLRQLLTHESPRVPFFAAISLGKLGDSSAFDPLVDLLAKQGANDPYIRHAAIMGLTGVANAEKLAALSTHPSRSVRLGAIVALRRQKDAAVSAFLKDPEELVLLEAARAIHDDLSIPAALPDLAALLERKGLQSEALLRRVINAAFRDGSDLGLKQLETYLKNGEGSRKLRRTALASIMWWSQPPVLDAVEGRYRKHTSRDAASANEAIARLQPTILADRDLLEVLLNGVVERGEARWLDGIDRVAVPLQARYLHALAKVRSSRLRQVVERSLTSPLEEVREAAREHAKQAGVPMVDLLLVILSDPRPAGQGQAVRQLAGLDDPRAKAKLAELFKAYQAGKAAPEWKLELWQAAQGNGVALAETPDRLELGGNAKRGKKLVHEHAAAQCIRCHPLGKQAPAAGAASIGPDLSSIGKTRDPAYLVASMLEPTRDITPGYGTIVLTTTESKEIAGILSQQTDAEWLITLADGTQASVNPKNIQSHTLTSVMPPIGALMTAEEIRDVVRYLGTLK